MIQEINLARIASANGIHRENVQAEVPAFVRQPSSGIKIQIPLIDVGAEEKAPAAIVIDTGNDANVIDDAIIPACDKLHRCGHVCYGVKNEKNCPPCLDVACADKFYKGGVNADDLCGICYTSELGTEAVTRLTCGHVFHTGCIKMLIESGWTGLRITWAFLSCPTCKHEIEIKQLPRELASVLGPVIALKKKAEKLALDNAERQGILKDDRVISPSGDYFGNPQAYANKRCSIYQCHSCKELYFGGLIDCE